MVLNWNIESPGRNEAIMMQRVRQKAQATTPTHAVRELHRTSGVASRQSLPVEGYGGNQATLRRLSRTAPHMQCKLQIGAVNDPLEAEADRVADQVMRMPDPALVSSASTPAIRRKCASCEDEEAKTIRGKSNGQALGGADAPPIVHDVLASPGQPLDGATRGFFESRFGADLGSIRVHNDDSAGRSAQAVGAQAYTSGRDIVFAPGRYHPQTADGQRLLAHELTHTIQQGAAGSPSFVARRPVTPALGISSTADALQRPPECPYDYKNCKGKSCKHPTGSGGFCSQPSIALGCICYKIENTLLVRWIVTVLLAALLAIGVVIALEALVAVVACFASGACELAALIAAVGLAGAFLIVKLLGSAPSGAVASASPDSGGTATDGGAPAADTSAASPADTGSGNTATT
jgi:hypothetical protein